MWNDSCNSSPAISGLQAGILREVKRYALSPETQLSNATEMLLCNESEDPKESLKGQINHRSGHAVILNAETLKFARKN